MVRVDIDFDFATVYCRQMKQKLEKQIDSLLNDLGLSMSETHYLYLFNKHNNLTLNEINFLLDVDKAYTTRIVNKLIDKSLITKTDDIRKYTLFLTDKGKEIVRLISVEIENTKNKLLKKIDDKELEIFKKVLIQMINNLEG